MRFSSSSSDKLFRVIVGMVVVLTLSLSPVVIGPNGTPGVQTACADGSCCPYNDAVCGLNGQNYENKAYNSGSCGGSDDGWFDWTLNGEG